MSRDAPSERKGHFARVRAVLVAALGWSALTFAFTDCSHSNVYLKEPAVALDATKPDQLRYRILLVGDAGHSDPGALVSARLADHARQAPDKTTVVFLGDNIYPAGMPPEGDPARAEAETNLLAQVDPFRDVGAELLFVPGNHDWDHSGPDGMAALARQEEYLRERGTARTRLAPAGGDPGPECLDRPGVRLALLDTQWWLHAYAHRTDVTQKQVVERLRACIDGASGHVLVAAHHPLQTEGLHGGFNDFRDHVFPLTRLHPAAWVPLPVIGSLYPLYRSFKTSPQDLGNDTNRHMLDALEGVFSQSPPSLYAAGHDHCLQVHDATQTGVLNVVSGAGSEVTSVSHGDGTLMATAQNGFMQVDVARDGNATLFVFVVDESGATPVYQIALPRPAATTPTD